MDTNLAILIGAIIYVIVTYLIIQLAVKSAMAKQSEHLQMICRLLVSKLKKDGYENDELTNLKYDSEEKFWEKVKR